MIRSDPVKGCSGHCQKGLIILMTSILREWRGTQNWGCYSCRKVRGGRTLSLHSEGRAIDVGIPGWLRKSGDEIFHWAIANAELLGLQEIVWYGRIWSASKPYIHDHKYKNSSNPTLAHRDHVHIGLNKAGANAQTAWFEDKVIHQEPIPEGFRGEVAVCVRTDPADRHYVLQANGKVTTNGQHRGDSYTNLKKFGVNGGLKADKAAVEIMIPRKKPGYWIVKKNGGVDSFNVPAYGHLEGAPLNKPIVGGACTNNGRGYWLVASDGGVFSFGDVKFYGSLGGVPLNKPVVGMAKTISDKGYWLVASDGGVFCYGDAKFYGSLGGVALAKPIVDIVSTESGKGYWLIGGDGGVFCFGDAKFYGSYPALPIEWRQGPSVLLSGANYHGGYILVREDKSLYRFTPKK